MGRALSRMVNLPFSFEAALHRTIPSLEQRAVGKPHSTVIIRPKSSVFLRILTNFCQIAVLRVVRGILRSRRSSPGPDGSTQRPAKNG